MTDAAPASGPAASPPDLSPSPLIAVQDERLLPAIVYGLYALGLFTGITVVVGVILAHLNQPSPNPRDDSHFRFQIRTFWIGLALVVANSVLMTMGAILSIILIGIPIMALSGVLFGAIWVWFCLRVAIGGLYLYRYEAYPRPNALIV